MAEKTDILNTLVTEALDLYGDSGHFAISKEDLAFMIDRPDLIASQVETEVLKRAEAIGKNYEFSVEEGMSPTLGDSFYIYWRPVKDD